MSEEKNFDYGRINYLTQHRNFVNIANSMELTLQERSLYEQLLELDNRTGWKEWFWVTNPDLQKWAHIPSYSSFAKARKRLVEKGFIHFVSGGTGKPCSYSLVKLYAPVPDNFQEYLELSYQSAKERKEDMEYMEHHHYKNNSALHDKNDVSADEENVAKPTTKSTHIHKHNKQLKKDINDTASQKESVSQAESLPKRTIDPVVMERHATWFAYYARGERLSHNEQKNLDYIELNFSTEAIEAAMFKADAKKKRSVGYVRSILERAKVQA